MNCANRDEYDHNYIVCNKIRDNEMYNDFFAIGSFTPKDKLLQKIHEKELISYKQTICRLEENNRHMLEEINNLKEALELHQTGIALHIEASGAWTNADI